MPGRGNTCVLGISLGMYLKNSFWPLYHFTVYSSSPSRSYLHCSVTVSIIFAAAGIITATSFRADTPESKWAFKKRCRGKLKDFLMDLLPQEKFQSNKITCQ